MLPGGILRISSIKSEDEGNYTCHARNIHNVDSINYNLVVIKEDKTPKSIKLKVEDATSKSIRIKVETSGHAHEIDSHSSSNDLRAGQMKIFFKNVDIKSESWKQLVINDGPSKIEDSGASDSSSFVLSNLICGNNYHVYVEVEGFDGTVSTSPILNAKTSGREPLAPPVRIFNFKIRALPFFKLFTFR